MRSKNAQLLIAMTILILLTVLVALPVSPVSAQYEGDPAPDFTITDIDGNVFTLSNYRGMVVLLEFFAPLCSLCQNEVAELKEVQETHGDGLVIASISRGTLEKTKSYRDEYRITWIVVCDLDLKVFQLYKVATVPTIFIVDQGGRIHFRRDDYTGAATLKAELEELGLPEFTAATTLPLLMIASFVAAFLGRKMGSAKHKGFLIVK